MIATSRENGWDRPFPRIRRAIADVDAVVMEEVAQRRSEDKLDGEDVLGMFLRTPDDQGRPMSDDEICDAMRTLLLGGHDTTASTLTWVLERVSRYPDALTGLETAALEGDDEYLDAVVKEAMRLRPAFPLTARLATEPFELPGLIWMRVCQGALGLFVWSVDRHRGWAPRRREGDRWSRGQGPAGGRP